MRPRPASLTAALLLLLAGISPAVAESVAIIVNSENQQNFTMQEIKYIYSEYIVSWPSGKRIERYDLPPDDPAREVFTRKVLGLSARVAALEEQSRSVNNSARNPSREKRAPLVAAAIVRSANALGYVSLPYAQSLVGVRIMHVIKE